MPVFSTRLFLEPFLRAGLVGCDCRFPSQLAPWVLGLDHTLSFYKLGYRLLCFWGARWASWVHWTLGLVYFLIRRWRAHCSWAPCFQFHSVGISAYSFRFSCLYCWASPSTSWFLPRGCPVRSGIGWPFLWFIGRSLTFSGFPSYFWVPQVPWPCFFKQLGSGFSTCLSLAWGLGSSASRIRISAWGRNRFRWAGFWDFRFHDKGFSKFCSISHTLLWVLKHLPELLQLILVVKHLLCQLFNLHLVVSCIEKLSFRFLQPHPQNFNLVGESFNLNSLEDHHKVYAIPQVTLLIVGQILDSWP